MRLGGALGLLVSWLSFRAPCTDPFVLQLSMHTAPQSVLCLPPILLFVIQLLPKHPTSVVHPFCKCVQVAYHTG